MSNRIFNPKRGDIVKFYAPGLWAEFLIFIEIEWSKNRTVRPNFISFYNVKTNGKAKWTYHPEHWSMVKEDE